MDQPPPQPSKGDLWLDVIQDMEERRLVGIERYGTPLQPHNGRKAEVDVYQELLDAVVYQKQKILEEEHRERYMKNFMDFLNDRAPEVLDAWTFMINNGMIDPYATQPPSAD